MKKNLRLLFAASLGLVMLGGVSTSAMAQVDPGSQMISSLDLDSVDVREALRALFKNVGVSYSIAPEVQGTVTVNLKNVTFEAALQNILKQVDSTYRIEGGVYQIIKREAPQDVPNNPDQPPTTTTNKVRRRVQVRHADPQFIATIIGSDKGNQSYGLAPEISTVANTPNGNFGGGGNGGFGGGGFGGGGFGGGGFGGNGGFGGGFGGGGLGGGGFGRGGGGGGFGRGGGGGFGGRG